MERPQGPKYRRRRRKNLRIFLLTPFRPPRLSGQRITFYVSQDSTETFISIEYPEIIHTLSASKIEQLKRHYDPFATPSLTILLNPQTVPKTTRQPHDVTKFKIYWQPAQRCHLTTFIINFILETQNTL
jgi:hypothetical protein